MDKRAEASSIYQRITAAVAVSAFVFGLSGKGDKLVSLVFPERAEASAQPVRQRHIGLIATSDLSPNTVKNEAQAHLTAGQEQIINQFKVLTAEQKIYLEQAVLTARQVTAEGAKINPAAMVAQSIIESGWGQHTQGNDYFGIKANSSWEGTSVSARTIEYQNGVKTEVTDAFRGYNSMLESFRDYVHLIQTEPWAQDATENTNNPELYLEGLQNGGPDHSYATSPTYVQDVMNIVNDFRLVELTSL